MDAMTLDLFGQPAPGPFSRRGALPTSREAAISVAPDVTDRQRAVLRLLAREAMTPDEAAARLGVHFMRVRPRFTELSRAGLVETTDERRPSALGNPQAVMRLTTLGRRVAQEAA